MIRPLILRARCVLLCCVCNVVGVVCRDEYDSQDGCTALIEAAWSGHADCARLLLDAGADKEARDDVRCCLLPF